MKTLTTKDSFVNSQEYDFNYFDITWEYSNPHDHEFYEFVLVISGEGIHEVNGSEFSLSPESFVCLRPQDIHTFRVEKNQCMRILNLAFCNDIADPVVSLFGMDAQLEFMNATGVSEKSKISLSVENSSTNLSENSRSVSISEDMNVTFQVKTPGFASLSENNRSTFSKVDKDGAFSSESRKDISLKDSEFYKKPVFHQQLREEQAHEIVEHYQKFIVMEKGSEIRNAMLRIFFTTLLSKTIFSNAREEYTESSLPLWLKSAISGLQMKENYEEGIGYLIRSTGKTASYICRMFQKHLNCSPSEYINSIRLKNACNLLRYTNKTIVDIGYDCGFFSTSHFNHLFKKLYGISPSVYRKTTIGRNKFCTSNKG